MLIKNKAYASYLVIIYDYKYDMIEDGVDIIGLTLELHDNYYTDYKNSVHRKMHKLFSKFYATPTSKS